MDDDVRPVARTARHRAIGAWAVLCLGGAAATAALNYTPVQGTSDDPGRSPAPSVSYAVDCQEIADQIERERARPQLTGDGRAFVNDYAVPAECADAVRPAPRR